MGVGIAEGTGVEVSVGTGIGVAEGTGVEVSVGTGVGVAEGTGVEVSVGTGVGVAEGTGVEVSVGTGIGVAEGTGVEVSVGTGVGVAEGTGVEVSVGVDGSSLHAARDMTDRTTTRPTNITWWILFRDRVPTDILSPPVYTSSLKHKVKVLDFIKSGGPELTIGRTIFEMWLGGL